MTRPARRRGPPRLLTTLALTLSLGACATVITLPEPMGGLRAWARLGELSTISETWVLFLLVLFPPLAIADVFASLACDLALLPITGPLALAQSAHGSGPSPDPEPTRSTPAGRDARRTSIAPVETGLTLRRPTEVGPPAGAQVGATGEVSPRRQSASVSSTRRLVVVASDAPCPACGEARGAETPCPRCGDE